MNTKTEGTIRFLIYQEKDATDFTGVCLDFGIVVEEATLAKTKRELDKASFGYLKTIQQKNLPDSLLNNRAQPEYFDIYRKYFLAETANTDESRVKLLKKLRDCEISVHATETVSIADLLSLPCYA